MGQKWAPRWVRCSSAASPPSREGPGSSPSPAPGHQSWTSGIAAKAIWARPPRIEPRTGRPRDGLGLEGRRGRVGGSQRPRPIFGGPECESGARPYEEPELALDDPARPSNRRREPRRRRTSPHRELERPLAAYGSGSPRSSGGDPGGRAVLEEEPPRIRRRNRQTSTPCPHLAIFAVTAGLRHNTRALPRWAGAAPPGLFVGSPWAAGGRLARFPPFFLGLFLGWCPCNFRSLAPAAVLVALQAHALAAGHLRHLLDREDQELAVLADDRDVVALGLRGRPLFAGASTFRTLLALAGVGGPSSGRHDEAAPVRADDEQLRAGLVGEGRDEVGALLQVDHQADRIAEAAAAGKLRGVEREEAAVRRDHEDLRGGLGEERGLERVVALELHAGEIGLTGPSWRGSSPSRTR